jgi:HEAT repeat protein
MKGLATVVAVVAFWCGIACGAEVFSKADVDTQLEALKGYNYEKGIVAHRKIEAIVRQCGEDEDLRRYTEGQMVRFLESDATAEGKWIVCKQLWIIGTEASVPVLGEMLKDEATAEMACYALRSNRSAAAGGVLCAALGQVGDTDKVRIANLLGERREEAAVAALSEQISSDNEEVVESAAVALGKISGVEAMRAIEPLRSREDARMRAVLAEADLRYAERLAAEGKKTQALAIHDAMMKGEDGLWRRAGLLGAMSIGGEEALVRMRAALAGDDEMLKNTAISNSAIVTGAAATRELIAELPRLEENEQVLLIYALADRRDAFVRGPITRMCDGGSSGVRAAALTVLGEVGDASSVAVLSRAIEEGKGEDERGAALGSLRMVKGEGIDEAIIEEMKGAGPE